MAPPAFDLQRGGVPTTRGARYLDTYAVQLTAAYRVQQIQKDIQTEQERVQYLDSLLGQARQTAAALEAEFKAQPPASLEAATALLKKQYEGQDAQRRRQAGEDAAQARALGLTAEERASLTPGGRTSAAQVAKLAADIVANPKTTAEKAAAVLTQVSGTLTPDQLASIQAAGARVAREGGTRARAPDVRKLTPQEAADQEVLNQLFESTYFAGPSGIVGGYEGKAVADLRATTKAPESTSYATAEDAYKAALAAVANGTLGRDDFDSDEDFAYAKDIYSEAKAKRAYRNDERANFENAVLTARKEVADLESKRAQQIGTTYDDPSQEFIRRELTARGYSVAQPGSKDAWKNRYVRYQKTPDYNVYIRAHELTQRAIDTGEPMLEPNTRGERIVATYTSMKNRRGEPISIADIRRQLDKVGIEGRLQDDAIAWSMAYYELGGAAQSKEALEARKMKKADQKAVAEGKRAEVAATDAAIAGAKQAESSALLTAEQQAAVQKKFDEQVKKLREDASMLNPEQLQNLEQRERGAMRAASFEGLEDLKGSVRSARINDPDGVYSYELDPSGESYIVYKGGIRQTTPARRGTPAFQSIEAVAKGGQPIPAAAPRRQAAPATKPAATKALPPVYDFSKLSGADLEKRTLAVESGSPEAAAIAAEQGRRSKAADTTSDFIRGPDGKMVRNPNKK